MRKETTAKKCLPELCPEIQTLTQQECVTEAVRTLQEYQIYGGTNTWNHRLHCGVLYHPNFHTSTHHPRQEGLQLPLHLQLSRSNGQFTMPVYVLTAPCTFTGMTSLRQPEQTQNELSRSMIPFFLLLEQSYSFRDQHVTR